MNRFVGRYCDPSFLDWLLVRRRGIVPLSRQQISWASGELIGTFEKYKPRTDAGKARNVTPFLPYFSSTGV